jgi:sterol desaturase/sphingolipid hydroxylase (fatty acid hydroxylase superfamily)
MHGQIGFNPLMAAVAGGAILSLFVLESWWPLRARVESRLRRVTRNASVGLLGAVIVRFGVLSVLVHAATFAQAHGLGLLPLLQTVGATGWPVWLLGFAVLDASMYAWHRVNHDWPLLWRFHRVHHVDRDLDVSTAFRFHPGELVLSLPFRALQTLLIGPPVWLALAYELAMQVATAMHHASWRWPRRFESVVQRVFVTPRMHQIHHSIVPQETSSNWSVVLSVWDRLAHSHRCDVSESNLVIGVPDCARPRDVTLGKLLASPFMPRRSLAVCEDPS